MKKKWQQEFLKIFREYYSKKKESDPNYSIRSMAKHLNISPGPASALLKGSRTWDFSTEWVLEVIEKMNLSPANQNRLRVLMNEPPIVKKQVLDSNHHADLLNVWYHSVILSSLDLDIKDIKPEILARNLGIDMAEVQTAIDSLAAAKLLTQQDNGSITRSAEVMETLDDVPNASIRKYHLDSLRLAKRALLEQDSQEREFQTLTFVGNRKMLGEVKQELRAFVEKIAVMMKQPNENDEIFRLSFQFFPIKFDKLEKSNPSKDK